MNLTDLNNLIPKYAANKIELDSYKKICDRENAEIKAIMGKFKQSVYETGDYRATYSVSQRETINEEMLLTIFDTESARDLGIIKTKEYIDFDALENAIYNNLIPKEDVLAMDKAREVKDVVTLRVTQIKQKKDEDKD